MHDDTVEVLGVDDTTNEPALCVKPMAGWTSAYSAAPCIAPSVLRALAKRAGVHIYVDENAVVYANEALISVTVAAAGQHTIRLKKAATVEDGFTGKVLAKQTRRLTVPFAERQSRLFLLRP